MSNRDYKGPERRQGYSPDALLERIHAIEVQLGNLTTEIQTKRITDDMLLKELTNLTRNHNLVIFGGPNSSGLKSQIDGLLKRERERDRKVNALVTTFITSIVGGIVSLIFFLVRKFIELK